MDPENVMLFKNQDKSYTITDLYLSHNISFGYLDVDKILLLKRKS